MFGNEKRNQEANKIENTSQLRQHYTFCAGSAQSHFRPELLISMFSSLSGDKAC